MSNKKTLTPGTASAATADFDLGGSSSSSEPLIANAATYAIDAWGDGFFAISDAGTVVVRPDRSPSREVDLLEIVEGLRDRGYGSPVLLHFGDVLDTVLRDLRAAFDKAIEENGYQGAYQGVFPVKVNQQRCVVEDVGRIGAGLGFGLEVGSKPELLAVLALTVDQPDRLIVCNGFKEDRYIEFAMLAAKLGRTIVPVLENLKELELVLQHAARIGVRPKIGIRVNLNTRGAGRWATSSGVKAKFGLSLAEVLKAVDILRDRGMLDCLELLHCHMGSQMQDIRLVMAGVAELARIYTELHRLGAGVRYIDVGGGLGVDYDGSQTNFAFSRNYSLEEYASTVVYRIQSICDDRGVPHPTIVTESGRAMVAQQSILIFDVMGSNRFEPHDIPGDLEQLRGHGDEQPARPLIDLFEAWQRISPENLLECWHDAQSARAEALNLFSLGYMSLEHRAEVERIFWTLALHARELSVGLDPLPEELAELDDLLTDVYFCNLSVFQSLPDCWAIDQVFPMMPIHRLDEMPTRRGTLADLTCDSDGKVDQFIDREDVRRWLPLHDLVPDRPYLLGAFLVGAYQETLGDLHNLFGDTHAAHVRVDDAGRWWIEEIIEGDTVREVLAYMQYDSAALTRAIRGECERSVHRGKMTARESREMVQAYENGLSGYTYLEGDSD
ncbi:MAG: biosynthetic arginine decarboxylase [Planctomycetota bacterium]|nr:biosynthetic arginine decarboxylase [Planctomycetota bacterium]